MQRRGGRIRPGSAGVEGLQAENERDPDLPSRRSSTHASRARKPPPPLGISCVPNSTMSEDRLERSCVLTNYSYRGGGGREGWKRGGEQASTPRRKKGEPRDAPAGLRDRCARARSRIGRTRLVGVRLGMGGGGEGGILSGWTHDGEEPGKVVRCEYIRTWRSSRRLGTRCRGCPRQGLGGPALV